jgi:RNA polymerase sigma-70 factor (ECF subfamily)
MQLLQGTVYAFSMKVCGHPEDAEDTMQEVLMRSLPHLAKIGDPLALAVWLYTVARNRCWRMRRKGAHAPKQMLSLDELAPDDAELGRLLEDRAKGPEAQLLDREKDRVLQQAVLTLPAPYRMVLVLHDMEELTAEQVAQVLGLKSGTVRVRLHRARLALRRQMSLMIQRAPAKPARRKKIRAAKKSAPKRSHRPAACREIFANLSEYLDGRLQPASCDEMQAHIAACPPCVAFIDDLRSAIERCRALAPKKNRNPRVTFSSHCVFVLLNAPKRTDKSKRHAEQTAFSIFDDCHPCRGAGASDARPGPNAAYLARCRGSRSRQES